MLHEYHVIHIIRIWRSALSAVFRNRGRSWDDLPVDTAVHLYLRGYSSRGVKFTNYFHLVLRLRIVGATTLFPSHVLWHIQGKLYFTI